MKKIVFFDIDGTLLDHDKNLPLSTMRALKELKNNGVFVAIATGRAPFMFESLREELEIDSFVSFNGQYVVFENQVIYQNPLDTNELSMFLKETRKNNHPLVFLTEKTMKASVDYHPFIEESLGTLKFPHPEEDVHFYESRNIYQSLVFCEEQKEQYYRSEYPGFSFVRWHPYSVDVLPSGGSKAEGIKKMIERLDFKLEDVYAFGDGLNDIEMLKAVGTGVAMGNGTDEAKRHANVITTDVDNNGIWNGLKELKLI
ncbi:Cof-type HAD-IIB family hydrolase [Neobacillus sp. PS3-12]|jgi:Cof subfamily protein (haloacid dehalogenase superfamily)|uniref:Cof-type HAD-IIB family hydrolase n=1 Tax=Neobacillus sp. PS3-12 TaxID=3070677 RepID=UPI0027DF6FC3|nr:Cof-type HAD-IIB family hydrolase [Neobacillus sp. PS3-12]WML51859.1 Cof-type HAD-IIB family hydrolase [Neobacillus sp. PS3-12]